MAVFPLPCTGNLQQLCDKSLEYWSSKQAQDSWTSLPTSAKCMILQLDRIFFEFEPIMQAPATTTQFIEQMKKPMMEQTITLGKWSGVIWPRERGLHQATLELELCHVGKSLRSISVKSGASTLTNLRVTTS